MKRIANLYDKIASLDNIYIAEKKARRGKTKKSEINSFRKHLHENIYQIHTELVNKTYSTSTYENFTIYEPKERFISKLPYKDRIVHHAILNYLEDVFVKSFTVNTYSCIKKRGIHKCLKDLTKALKNKADTEYCLKLDIKKFYPSINNDILKGIIRKKVKDKDLLGLLDNIIDSCKGIPLGNYTSQYFGNLYLNGFDHWLKEVKKVRYYFRYCDDIVILGSSKEELHQLRKDIQGYLREYLGLDLSNYQVFPVASRGINFVGYVSFHTHIWLRDSIKRKFKKMLKDNRNDKSIASYHGWIVHSNGRNLEYKLLNFNTKQNDNN